MELKQCWLEMLKNAMQVPVSMCDIQAGHYAVSSPGQRISFHLFCKAQAYICAKMSSSPLKVGDSQGPAGALGHAERGFRQKKLH